MIHGPAPPNSWLPGATCHSPSRPGPGIMRRLPLLVAGLRIHAQHIARQAAGVGRVHRDDDGAGDRHRAHSGDVAVRILRLGEVLRIREAVVGLDAVRLAGLHVDRVQLGVVGQEVDVVAVDRDAAMLAGEKRHVVAAPVVRQLVLVLPDDVAVAAVQREYLVVLREVDHAIVEPRRCLRVGLAAGENIQATLRSLALPALIGRACCSGARPVAIGVQPGSAGLGRELGVANPSLDAAG